MSAAPARRCGPATQAIRATSAHSTLPRPARNDRGNDGEQGAVARRDGEPGGITGVPTSSVT
ncbi:hypothetical protein [Streptomyces sp. NPDC091259]|uniref:hypothetical protein n=1 Tax=Streptomyces sp. NPDC091259 TaxID=3365976 RepID=UPI0037FA231F